MYTVDSQTHWQFVQCVPVRVGFHQNILWVSRSRSQNTLHNRTSYGSRLSRSLHKGDPRMHVQTRSQTRLHSVCRHERSSRTQCSLALSLLAHVLDMRLDARARGLWMCDRFMLENVLKVPLPICNISYLISTSQTHKYFPILIHLNKSVLYSVNSTLYTLYKYPTMASFQYHLAKYTTVSIL